MQPMQRATSTNLLNRKNTSILNILNLEKKEANFFVLTGVGHAQEMAKRGTVCCRLSYTPNSSSTILRAFEFYSEKISKCDYSQTLSSNWIKIYMETPLMVL